MDHPTAGDGPDLERYREYLRTLARLQVRDALRGLNEAQLAAWLRRALANNLADEARRLGARVRDVGRERQLSQAVDESSARLEVFLAAEQASPSHQAARQEDL